MTETLCQELMQKFSKALTMFEENPSLKRQNESLTHEECAMIYRAVTLQFIMIEGREKGSK